MAGIALEAMIHWRTQEYRPSLSALAGFGLWWGLYFAWRLKELRPYDTVNVAAEMRPINPVKGVFRVFFGVYPGSSSTRTGSLEEEPFL
ncbi:hypothetical protein ABNQ38_17280 [Azospirillum sp. A29]|uniref:hypothetical protein n=1 Tax=Azospirillum sp. A29 TaxID=3160606 RepID=UPI003670FB35